jgi:uncharacterized MAPEG superfamily protein
MPPQEKLPDPAPMSTFFLPNFLGIAFALGMEKLGMEQLLNNLLARDAHPYCLLGLGVFLIANANSFLGGSVVCARIAYDVKLPNLYASTTTTDDDKTKKANAVLFNCIQRGHQNFIENYAQLVLSVLFTALVANRPNVAGLILIVVAICRVLYGIRYRIDVDSRIGPLLLAMFSMSIGVGYGFLVALSGLGIQMLKEE